MTKIKTLGILCFTVLAAITTITFIACQDEDNVSLLQKNDVLEDITTPENGFKFVNTNGSDTTIVSTGTSLYDFMRERTVVKSNIVEVNNIIYAFEDVGKISISQDEEKGYTLYAFDDTFKIFDVMDETDGSVSYKITHTGGDTVYSKVYYDSLNAENFIKFILSKDVFENPFTPPVEKFFLSSLAISLAGVLVSAASVVVSLYNDSCQNSREIDKHNCEQSSKKCLKAKGRCHYECISCPDQQN